ncbi:MAG: hypothetical protein QM762_12760 [Chryseolinea sp.]
MIPALVALGTAAYQWYQSDQQKKKAKKLKPSNYVPPGTEEALTNARMDATAQSPGYARGLEKLRQSSATTIANAKRVGGNPAAIQQAVADTDAREKEAIKDLQVSDEAFRASNRKDLNRQLQIKAGYQKDSYDAYNASKSALIGASQQNKYNAITQLGEGVINSLPDSAIAGKTGTATTPTSAADAARSLSGVNLDNMTDGQIQELYRRMGISKGKSFMTGY